MSSEIINDGGAAFPRPNFISSTHFSAPAQDGMSLRDWFAGSALGALLGSLDQQDVERIHKMPNDRRAEMFANHAYLIADAMLAAREKKGTP